MAGIRFETTVFSYNGWSYFIQIWDRNFGGTHAYKITLGQGGPEICWDSDSDDRFSTIISSTCKIPLMVDDPYVEGWLNSVRNSYEEKDVYIHIYRNNQATALSLIWSGFMLMDLASTVDEFRPYEHELTFTDGISLLKEVDFVVDGASKPYDKTEVFSGPSSYSFWMKTILGKVGMALTTEGAATDWEWRTSLNWYNTGHGASAPSTLTFDPFAKTECQVTMFREQDEKGNFVPSNCYEVLHELLKHWGARIVYWRHKFWIVQIPELTTSETGTLANPDNINTRKYFHTSGSVSAAFDNLDDYWTPYQVKLQTRNVIGPSKLVGTKYDFKPPVKEVLGQFITGSGENYFGGFPTTESTVVTQVPINNLASASSIFIDIPLRFTQDRANVDPNQLMQHTSGVAAPFITFDIDIRFVLKASNTAHGGSTEKYLWYDYGNQAYSWNNNFPQSSTNKPRWYKSNATFSGGTTGVTSVQFGGPDNGSPIFIPTDSSFTGVFDLSIEIFAFSNPFIPVHISSNKYNFVDHSLTLPTQIQNPNHIGLTWANVPSMAGTTIAVQQTITGGTSAFVNAVGSLSTTTYSQANGNPFAGHILALSTGNNIAATSQRISQNSGNINNSNIRDFDELLWGDSPAAVSRGSLEVVDTSGTKTTTVSSGQWGVGVTNGTQTFSEILLDQFLQGQMNTIKVGNFQLVIPTNAKEKDDGTAIRPQYINPVGVLVEKDGLTEITYVMSRGAFHILKDEWDYSGFEIKSESTSSTTVLVTDDKFGTLGNPITNEPIITQFRPVSNDVVNFPIKICILTRPITPVGTNVVLNSDFATDTVWSAGTGWAITGSQARFTGSSSGQLTQTSVIVGDLKYIVTVDVDEISGGTLRITDGTTTHKEITEAGNYAFSITASNTSLVLDMLTSGVERTVKVNSVLAQETSSTTSLEISPIGEAIFSTGDKCRLINNLSGDHFDLTINANQSATDTTLTIQSTDFLQTIGVNSVITFNPNNLVKEYQDDTLQEVTDNGNTTTNAVMIGSSTTPVAKLEVDGTMRVINQITPASGQGLEIGYSGGGKIRAFNRDTSAYKLLDLIASNVIVKISGSETARFDSTGLGIATSSPSEKLHVVGNAKILGTITNSHFTIPNAAGGAGQVLKYPTSGSVLTWGSVSGGSGLTNYALLTCGDQTATTSATDGEVNAVSIPFDTSLVSGTSNTIALTGTGLSGIANSENAWYFPTAGKYEFSWTITTDTASVNNRILVGVKLQRATEVADAFSWSDYTPTTSYIYNRGTGQIREGSTASQTLITMDATQYYWRLVIWKEESSDEDTTAVTVLNGCNVIIKQLE